jgi:hypothetical protein
MAEVSGDRMTITRIASGDLNFADPGQYRFVAVTGRDVHLCGSGAMALGVLGNKPKDNEHATVVTFGHTKVSLGSSIGAGTLVQAGVSGWASNAASGGAVMGRLLTGAASGLIGEMFVTQTGSGR